MRRNQEKYEVEREEKTRKGLLSYQVTIRRLDFEGIYGVNDKISGLKFIAGIDWLESYLLELRGVMYLEMGL